MPLDRPRIEDIEEANKDTASMVMRLDKPDRVKFMGGFCAAFDYVVDILDFPNYIYKYKTDILDLIIKKEKEEQNGKEEGKG